MSAENKALVRRAIEAFNRGDLDGLTAPTTWGVATADARRIYAEISGRAACVFPVWILPHGGGNWRT